MRQLPTVKIKGKEYVMVKDRIIAFREDHPDWSIVTEIVDLTDGMVIFKASVLDETGRIIGTGHAYEREGSSQINSTSFIENAETSAIGRAVAAACAIGIDDSYGSANEVAQAMIQQSELATEAEKKSFMDLCKMYNVKPTDILREAGWRGGKMTKAQHGLGMMILKERFEDGRMD